MVHPVPVTDTVVRDVSGMGPLNFPVYRWRYYNIHTLTDLGLTTTDEEVAAGTDLTASDMSWIGGIMDAGFGTGGPFLTELSHPGV